MLRKEQVSEIKRMYRESKDKKKQIGILADLNTCTKEEIREVLGMKAPGPQPEKVVDTKVKEQNQEGIDAIGQALQSVLDEFDDNEKKMRSLMEKMVPLAAEYKEIELRQQTLAEFIENFCRINGKKTT